MSSEDFFADLLPKVAAKESEEDSILPMPISSASSNNGTEKGSKGLGGPAIMQVSPSLQVGQSSCIRHLSRNLSELSLVLFTN